jgi:hypothetical protein
MRGQRLRAHQRAECTCAAVIAAADERGYARLVLSPSAQSVPFYRRAGFVVPGEAAGNDRLLVRQALSRNGG